MKNAFNSKTILRIVGTYSRSLYATALAAVIGFSVLSCDNGSTGGGGGGGTTGGGGGLNGTWTAADGETLVLNNGSFTASQDNVEIAKGTYTASGSTVTMTVTQVLGSVLGEDVLEMGLSPTQWYNQQQLRTAVINYALSQGLSQAQAEPVLAQYVSPIFAPQTGTYSGNTLTMNFWGETATYTGSGGGGGGGGSMTWTAVSNSTFGTNQIYAVAYGNNKFVAGGDNGKMAYSADGATWTPVGNSTFGTSDIRAIAYGNNMFVAVGDAKMAYSPDGINWTAVTNSPFGTYYTVYAIAYGNNMFVAGGNIGMAYSTDGINWTAVTNKPFATIPINAIAYGNNMFVAGTSNNGGMEYSMDGINWTAVNSTFSSSSSINAIGYGNGKFVAEFTEDLVHIVAYSTNGVAWTAIKDSTAAYDDNRINAIAFGNGKFVACRGLYKMAYSTDGVAWTTVHDNTFTFTQKCIAYGNSTFVAGGDYGKIWYSSGN